MVQLLSRPFDLEIDVDSGGDTLRIRVLDSPLGPLREPVLTPNPCRDPNLQPLVEKACQPGASSTVLRRLGQQLSRALLPEAVGQLLHQNLSQFAEPETPLRMRIMLSESLTSLPWELAYDEDQNSFLAVDPRLSMLRIMRPTTPGRQSSGARGLGMLVSISQGPVAFDYATQSLIEPVSEVLERLPNLRSHVMHGPATIPALIESLRGSVNILHLYTQAGYENGSPILFMSEVPGQSAAIYPVTFDSVLRGSSVPLAILSVNMPFDRPQPPDATRALLAFAAQLVTIGTPAVLAVPLALSKRTEFLLWHEFYSGLVKKGQPLDIALSASRMALWSRRESSPSWYIPTLFAAPDESALWPLGQSDIAVTAQQQWRKSLP